MFGDSWSTCLYSVHRTPPRLGLPSGMWCVPSIETRASGVNYPVASQAASMPLDDNGTEPPSRLWPWQGRVVFLEDVLHPCLDPRFPFRMGERIKFVRSHTLTADEARC